MLGGLVGSSSVTLIAPEHRSDAAELFAGVVTVDDSATDAETVIAQADQAMYTTKRRHTLELAATN